MEENSTKEISKFKKMVVESFGIAAESGAVMAIDILVNAILGTFANGIVAAKFSYQLKRLEDNFKIAIPEMIRRLDKIEGVLTEEKQNVIESEVLPTYWDYVQQEPEGEKIYLFANTVEVFLTKQDVDVEMMHVYFNVLQQLRVNEIKMFKKIFVERQYEVIKDHSSGGVIYIGGNLAYHEFVRTKLERVGLISLGVIDANGTIDEYYRLTELGEKTIEYFISIRE